MDRTFWTMHLDGPKHLGQKWANRWMLTKKMGQKKWSKFQGQKNGPIWLQLQNTIFMGQKKRDKRYQHPAGKPTTKHAYFQRMTKNTATWNIWPQEKSLQKLSLTSVFTTTHAQSLRS